MYFNSLTWLFFFVIQVLNNKTCSYPFLYVKGENLLDFFLVSSGNNELCRKVFFTGMVQSVNASCGQWSADISPVLKETVSPAPKPWFSKPLLINMCPVCEEWAILICLFRGCRIVCITKVPPAWRVSALCSFNGTQFSWLCYTYYEYLSCLAINTFKQAVSFRALPCTSVELSNLP